MQIIAPLASLLLTVPAADKAPRSMCGNAGTTSVSQSAAVAAVERLANDWVNMVNTADDATYVRFVQDRGPVLRGGPDQWLELRNEMRGLELCGVKSADEDTVELWAFDVTWDTYVVIHMKSAEASGQKIQVIAFRNTDESPPGVKRPQKLPIAALIEAVDTRAAARAAADQFSGAVLLARNGRVLFQKAYGLAHRERGEANTLDTQFRFGSMGKMFTAVAIMQLVEQGKIDLNGSVGRYLPGYPNIEVATKVTVAHLLSHTGGTGDIFGPEFEAHRARLRDSADYAQLFGDRPPKFTPGSQFAYSNYGFMLLGRIVEQVSGRSYDDYVQRKIFDPAGMVGAGNRPEGDALPWRAVGYTGYGLKLRRADDTLPLKGTPSGGGYATVGDFHRFVAALNADRLLGPRAMKTLTEDGVKTAGGQFARYDFGGSMTGVGRFIGHGGAHHGISGSLHHFIKHGFTVIVLANRDPGTAESISMFAAHRLPSE